MAVACSQLTNKVALLVGKETEDTSNTVDADGYTAVLAKTDLSFSIESEEITRDVLQTTFSKLGSDMTARVFSISAGTEIKGGGESGGELVEPEMSNLLQISGLQKKFGKKVAISNLSGTFEFNEDIESAAATAASHVGNVDLSIGNDWSVGSQDFAITVNGTGPTTVTLTANTTNLTEVITEINAALSTATVTGIEAYDGGSNYVGIRTTSTGVSQTFTLAVGSTDALATLGWTAGTYTGADATVTGTIFEVEAGVLWMYQSADISVGSSITGSISGATADVDSETDLLVYKPLTEECNVSKSGIVDFYQHNTLIHAYGVRSDASFTFEKIATASFEMMGIYSEPSDEELPDVTVSSVTPPVFEDANFTIGALDTTTIPIAKAELKLGASVVKKQGANSPDGIFSLYHSDRVVTATLDPDVTRLTNYDPYALARNRTELKLAWEYGSEVGNRIRCVLPRTLMKDPERSDTDNRLKYTLNFDAVGSKDDELFFVFY